VADHVRDQIAAPDEEERENAAQRDAI